MNELKHFVIGIGKNLETDQPFLFATDNEGNVRLLNGEVYLKSEADMVIAKLKTENERLKAFRDELVKDCKWLPITYTPDINGFETMVQCTNGKKRVASFRKYDLCWYDVNNGNKLNVVKWLWRPKMATAQ
jgi:hypothetical protein